MQIAFEEKQFVPRLCKEWLYSGTLAELEFDVCYSCRLVGRMLCEVHSSIARVFNINLTGLLSR